MRATCRVAAAMVLSASLLAPAVRAAEPGDALAAVPVMSVADALQAVPGALAPGSVSLVPDLLPAARGRVLPGLYVSFAALQAYDGLSTLTGLGTGARERNVMVGTLAGKPAAFWAVKSATTAGVIVVAERLWREHRRGQALATLAVANGLALAIDAHNAAVLRSQR